MKSAKTVRLGDVCEVVRGVRVTRKDLAPSGQYPVYQNSLKPLGMYNDYNCEGNNPFMIMALAAGEVAWSESPFWAADDCTYFRNLKGMDARYLYYLLRNSKNELMRHVNQATIPRLSNKILENLVIPLPPLATQRAIVARLDSALARAGALEKRFAAIAQNAELSFKASLNEEFAGRTGGTGETSGTGGSSDSRSSSTSRNPSDPSKPWPLVRLGDVCEVITKGTTPTSIGFKFQEKGVNFLKIESFAADGSLVPEKVAHISSECHAAMMRSQLKAGDILFSIAGALGRVAIIKQKMLPANTNQALAIIRVKHDSGFDIEFLQMALQSPIIATQFKHMVKVTAQPNLSLSDIADFTLPLPPLPVQRAIVSRLDAARKRTDGIAEQARRGAAAAENLKKALLKEAFE